MSEEVATPQTESVTTEVIVEDGQPKDTEISYLDGKYKSVSELEKGYKELQSTFTKKTQEFNDKLGAFKGAPENYELPEGITVDQKFLEWAKEKQFSNEAVVDFINFQNERQQQEIASYQEAEIKKLGDNAKVRIKNASDWAKANLGDEFAEAINNQFVGALSIQAIEKMMQMSKNTMPAKESARVEYDKDKLDYMQFQEKDANGERRYVSDPAFRAKVLKLREDLLN